MSKFVARFVKDESGATAIEYGLIAALIAVVIITCRDHPGHQPRRQFGQHRQQGQISSAIMPDA